MANRRLHFAMNNGIFRATAVSFATRPVWYSHPGHHPKGLTNDQVQIRPYHDYEHKDYNTNLLHF